MRGTDIAKAEKAVDEVINELKNSALADYELEKVKNRFESSVVISNTSILNKAINLSMYELLGDPDLVNREIESYRSVSREMVRESAIKYLRPENCTTMFYLSDSKK